MNIIYVTPAGYVCSCGHANSAPAGGQALRWATDHAEQHERALSDEEEPYTIIDYRRVVNENARLSQQVASNTEAMQTATDLIDQMQIIINDKSVQIVDLNDRIYDLTKS